MTRATCILAIVAVLLPGCGPRSLSDADLVAYSASTYDKKEMMDKHLVLGVHGGISVVVDFPCSDLCPEYTSRIIHYDVSGEVPCAAHGGVTVLISTPVGIGQLPVRYCVPKVLADNAQARPGQE